MTFSVGLFRTAPLLLASLMLGGCLPAAPGDEEKEQFYMAGKDHARSMDFNGAVESFEKAVEVNPKSAPAHFELGLLYDQKVSDPAAAIYHYERYLKLLPNSDKEDRIKMRILACQQQLAQSVSLAPLSEKQQRDLELLLEERNHLREEVEKWRAYATRLQNLTNQTSPGSAATHVVSPSPSGPSAATSAVPLTPVSPNRSPVTPAATPRTHIVKTGETPSAIARKYGVKLEALMAANPRVEARRLRPGQALTIPGQ